MNQEHLNRSELRKMQDALKHSEKYGFSGVIFKGYIEFTAYNKTIYDELEVTLVTNDMNPQLKIDVNEKSTKIRSDYYHKNFRTGFDDTIFYFDTENLILKINGDTDKMGVYEVAIWEKQNVKLLNHE